MVRDTNPADKQNPPSDEELILSIRSLNTLHIPPAEIAKRLKIATDDVRFVLAHGMTPQQAEQDLVDSVCDLSGCGVPLGAICREHNLTFEEARFILHNRRLPSAEIKANRMASQHGGRAK